MKTRLVWLAIVGLVGFGGPAAEAATVYPAVSFDGKWRGTFYFDVWPADRPTPLAPGDYRLTLDWTHSTTQSIDGMGHAEEFGWLDAERGSDVQLETLYRFEVGTRGELESGSIRSRSSSAAAKTLHW